MSNRFPEEPYAVITDWPGVEHHNIGEHRCFHYTLTLAEVRHKADVAGDIATSTDIGTTVFLDILGVIGLFVSPPAGLCIWATNLYAQMADADQKAMQCNLFKIWEEIGTEMAKHNCPRVTISQVLKLDYVKNNTTGICDPTWIPEGVPRVPLGKYYLDH